MPKTVIGRPPPPPSNPEQGEDAMQRDQEHELPEVGKFEFALYGTGRNSRYSTSRFQVRCDAVALDDNEILLLSIVGAETSVKALTAALRSPEKDQRRL